MENTLYTLMWVTDPFDPQITLIHNKIIEALTGPRFKIINRTESGLEQSIIKTTYYVEQLDGAEIDYEVFLLPEHDAIKVLIEMIGKINYDAVNISLALNSLEIMDVDMLAGVKSIIKKMVGEVLYTKVGFILENKFQLNENITYMSYMPYLEGGSAIYRKDKTICELIKQCDLNNYKGYQYLTKEPLIDLALDELSNEDLQLTPKDLKKVVLNNGKMMMLITAGVHYDQIKRRIIEYILKLKSENYYVIPGNKETILELAKMFNIEIKSTKYDQIIVKSPHYSEYWINDNKRRLENNKLPRYIIEGKWQKKVREITATLIEAKAKLLYAALRAFTKLSYNNPILSTHIIEVEVLNDLSISIPVTSGEDIERFKSYLKITMEGLTQWYVIAVDNVIYGIVWRWYTMQTTGLFSMVLLIEDQNVLIVNTPDGSRFKLKEYDNTEKSLIEKLTSLYGNNADLEQLLYSIKYDNQIYSVPELYQKITKDNEILPEKLVATVLYYVWGLRGLFPTHTIFDGLLRTAPTKHLTVPPEGYVVLVDDESGGSGQYSVEIARNNGYMIPLFQIRIDDKRKGDEFYQIVNALWRCGWFLTDWAGAYAIKTGQLSSLLVTNPNTLVYNTRDDSFLYNLLQKYAMLRCGEVKDNSTTGMRGVPLGLVA